MNAFFKRTNPQKKDPDGHILTELWADYKTAVNQDRPAKQIEILKKIREQSMSQRLPWDFYDASTRYISASVGTTAVSGAPQVVVVGSGKPYNAPADANGETLSTQASQIAESPSSENGASAPTASTVSAPQPNFVPQMSQEEAEALNEAQGNYVDELKNLVETLKKVSGRGIGHDNRA